MYVIEKNIPIPESNNNAKLSELMRSMEVGDSTIIDKKHRSNVTIYASYNNMKMKTKTVNGVLRMWRIE